MVLDIILEFVDKTWVGQNCHISTYCMPHYTSIVVKMNVVCRCNVFFYNFHNKACIQIVKPEERKKYFFFALKRHVCKYFAFYLSINLSKMYTYYVCNMSCVCLYIHAKLDHEITRIQPHKFLYTRYCKVFYL